ncbi:Wzz/FepE/Etk N-terminal domain-containing protein [Nocardioides sp. MAHUQ-72]|uniref:Wzz/FepE/Etk N-terminal domain-containing protein n=1 Tax=unclassified Nocardioides TaxID=2615069 RepID=UPI0036166681
MVEPTAAYARDLGDYVALVRRRWTWVVGCVLAGLALASLYLATASATYVSTAKVLVEDTGPAATAEGARTNDSINLDTEAQLVKSETVASRAKDMLNTELSPVALSRHVGVTVPANTTIMSISFTGPTAAEAQRGAETFAEAYLAERQESAQNKIDAHVDRLNAQIEKTTQSIQDTNVALGKLIGAKETSDRAFLLARRATLSNQLTSYNAELAPLVGTEVDAGKVIVDAQKPGRPTDPNAMLILPAGLMAGLLAGLALAVWRERRDKRLHNGAEVERLFGLAPLSTLVAEGRGGEARIDHDVRALYHSLRANGPEGREVALLVGPDDPETAERLAYSLAVVAARSGAPTAYVTRPHSPVVLDRRRATASKTGTLRLPDYEELGIVVDGEFHSANLREQLAELGTKRDFVILGLPNDDPGLDVPILGRYVDVAVVVVRLGVTRRDTLGAVLADLTRSGVDQVSLVTVDLGRRRMRRGAVSADEVFVDPSERARALAAQDEDDGEQGAGRQRSLRARRQR